MFEVARNFINSFNISEKNIISDASNKVVCKYMLPLECRDYNIEKTMVSVHITTDSKAQKFAYLLWTNGIHNVFDLNPEETEKLLSLVNSINAKTGQDCVYIDDSGELRVILCLREKEENPILVTVKEMLSTGSQIISFLYDFCYRNFDLARKPAI